MKRIINVINSTVEPGIHNLWLINGYLKYFSATGWKNLNSAFDATPLYDAVNNGTNKVTEEFKKELQRALDEGRITYMYSKRKTGDLFKLIITFAALDPKAEELSLDVNNYNGNYKFTLNLKTNEVIFNSTPTSVGEIPSAPDIYAFNLTNNEEENKLNLKLAADILFGKVEAVAIKGTLNGVDYNTLGVYHDGYITAVQKNQYIVFNVSFQDGHIEAETITEVNKSLPYVTIKVGNSNEIMQFNSENIPNGEFFIHSDYGFGVGTYQDGVGGFAHITSAYGNELFYDINTDGSVMPNREYVKPNEPYTVILEESNIGKTLDEVTSSAVKKAGEIIVNTSVGPITYTRTTDSTSTFIYFTDSKKDGQIALLTYTDNNKMLQFTTVDMKKATSMTVGGILQGNAIANATTEDLVAKFNSLLVELRKTGVIAEQ